MTRITNVPVDIERFNRALLTQIWPFTFGESQMKHSDFAVVKAMFDHAKHGRLDEAAVLAGQNDVAFRFWMNALEEIERMPRARETN